VYNVIPFDSASGSIGISYMCREARLMERQGRSMEEILARLTVLKDQCRLIFTLDTLDFARMSGRVSALTAMLASVINLKPVGTLKDGLLEIVEKVRTRKASIDRIIEVAKAEFGNRPVFMAVLYIRDTESGTVLGEKVKSQFNIKEYEMVEMSISLAANFGPGTLGLLIYPME
jgi:DegV family protein with EDD domain